PGFELEADGQRVELKRRRHAVGQRETAHGLEVVQLFLQTRQSHVNFRVREVEADEFLRVNDHLAGNGVGVGLGNGGGDCEQQYEGDGEQAHDENSCLNPLRLATRNQSST